MYFQVRVEFETESDKGKPKKERVSYLVNALSVTEAEAKTVKYLTEERHETNFEVKSASESKIVTVIEDE